MVHDYEAARKVWEAQVPIEVGLEGSRPLYMMVPRCTYFCSHINKIVQHFSSQDSAVDPDSIWLESMAKTPIKTFYPVGVLYDLMKPDDSDIWTITLRSGPVPAGVHFVNRESMEMMFMQAVKEADYLKTKAEVISSMKNEDHHRLWNGVVQYNFDEFWSVNRRLTEETPLHVPIRLYEQGKAFRQVPLKPSTDSGDETTLASALSTLSPDLDPAHHSFISHGIQLPLDTPIAYLSSNLAYPDNFVHICAVPV